MKKGFTLAEVLITLAIIGVVAALTIPVVVHKYQQKAYYTKFMKAFNTVSNALQLAQAEHGNPRMWGTHYNFGSGAHNIEVYETNLFPYLRIERVCSSASDCGIPNNLIAKALNYSGLEASYTSDLFSFDADYAISPVILNDGSIVQFVLPDIYNTSGDGEIYVDTNGIKGPNIVGRDIFRIPVGSENGAIVVGKDVNSTEEEIAQGCSTTQASYGTTCASRLLRDGKMDY